MYQSHKDRVAFLFVYVREAHPVDGWQVDSNVTDGVLFEKPRTDERRREIARACCDRLKLTMPCAVDGLDNAVDDLYAAWPERVFIIGVDGRIAYAGDQGPWGFKPDDAERRLRKLIGG
jgi:hypothetical protein